MLLWASPRFHGIRKEWTLDRIGRIGLIVPACILSDLGIPVPVLSLSCKHSTFASERKPLEHFETGIYQIHMRGKHVYQMVEP
jgi:hypothetical protein